jgi:diaminopimelate decarboxylase
MHLQGTMKINHKGHLEIGGCDVVDLAQEFGTPLYIVDEQEIRDNCRAYTDAFRKFYPNSETIYAGKTFLTTAMCKIIEEEGLGLDVVSGGELYTALQAKFPTNRIYFHGNNKTPDEIELALDNKVGKIVVDNLVELRMLNQICEEKQTTAQILIRVTPGIEPETHSYIQTGQLDSKFGFGLTNGQTMEAIKEILNMPSLSLLGLHCHIGSQIFGMESYKVTTEIMVDFLEQVRKELGITLTELNLGGGLGIKYTSEDQPPSVDTHIEVIVNALKDRTAKYSYPLPKLVDEPGRSIIGTAGSTIYTVGTIKEVPGIRKYVAVNGGMVDNPRPALYNAKYEAIIANKANLPPQELVSIAGKCCESGDMLIWDIELPKPKTGDILLVSCTGAYNYSMASNYNRIPRPAVVLVNDGRADLIVKRETYSDLIRNDLIPERLKNKDSVFSQAL